MVHTSSERSNAWMLCANARCPTDPNRANPFPTKVCSTSLVLCLSPLSHQPLKTKSTTSLGPTNSFDTDSPNTSKALSNGSNRVFEVLFSQFQSRFISPQNVVFAFWVIEILSTVSWPPSSSKRLSLLGFRLAS